jgi:histone H2A
MRGRHEQRAVLQRCATRKALRRMAQRADAAAAAATTCAGATETSPSYAAGGCTALAWEEMRGLLRAELELIVRALAPACWKPSCLLEAQLPAGSPLSSWKPSFLTPGHVLTAADVLAALDGPKCIRAQSALARPGSRAQRAALRQCKSLTQLVRCVFGQAGGIVGQLGRGIAVEELAAAPASVAELCRAFEDVPALARLLPRRVQAAPGRLLMAQQRLLLAHLGVQGSLMTARMDCLDHDTVLKTLGCFEEQGDMPLNWRLWDAPPSLGAGSAVHAAVHAAGLAIPAEQQATTVAPEAGDVGALAAAEGTLPDARPGPDLEPKPKPEPEPEPELEPELEPEPDPEEPEHDELAPAAPELEPDYTAEVSLRAQISAVLGQVHPGTGITSAGQLVLEELTFGHVEPQLISSAWQRVRQRLAEARLAQEAAVAVAEQQETQVIGSVHCWTAQPPGMSLAEVAAAMSPADLVVAVRMHFQGELAKHGIKEGLKAVKKFDLNRAEGDTTVESDTHSERAGLVFCVQRSVRQLWQQTGAHGDGPSDSMLRAAVFLAAANEYMCAEILEQAGNAAHDNRKDKIVPRHIVLGIRNDEELNKLFKDIVICGGGVLPYIHAVLHSRDTFPGFFAGSESREIMQLAESSNDGDTNRIILAYEALEECASDFGSPSTDKDPVIGQQAAWRVARLAGIKFLDEAVAPMLNSLAESAISGVLHCAVAAATSTVDTDDGSGDSVLETTGRHVDVGQIRKSIKAEPFLFGQVCVGVSGTDDIVFRVSGSLEEPVTSDVAVCKGGSQSSKINDSDSDSETLGSVDSDEEYERAQDLLSSVENLSAANLRGKRSYASMSDGDKAILLDRINAMGEKDLASVQNIVVDAETSRDSYCPGSSDNEWEIWRTLEFGEVVDSMEYLDAIHPSVLWMLRSFVDKIDKVDEIEEMPVREMPVGWVQVGQTNADRIALRRIRNAQGNRRGAGAVRQSYLSVSHTTPILSADHFEAVALAQLGGLVAEATGVGSITISSTSLAVLRLAVEQRLLQLLQEAQLAAIHSHRFCVRPTDLRFVILTQGTCLAPGVLPADVATDAMVAAATLKAAAQSNPEPEPDRRYDGGSVAASNWALWEASEDLTLEEEEEDDDGDAIQSHSSAVDDMDVGMGGGGGGGGGDQEEDRASLLLLREIMAANNITLAETVTADYSTPNTTSYSSGGSGTTINEWSDLVLPRKPFEELARSLCHEVFGTGGDAGSFTQFTSPAVLALQASLEAQMHTIMHVAALATWYAGRTRIVPLDIQLARRLLHLRD